MKTIGLLGGMSWESTIPYYRIINQEISARLGGLHSARIVLHSVDFQPIEELQHAGDWNRCADILIDASRGLERAGADLLVICTNTMHRVAPEIARAISIPLVHIADATARAILAEGMSTVGLLGTKFTMEQQFYRGRLEESFGLRVLVPAEDDRGIIHGVIYDELCRGEVLDRSRSEYVRIIEDLVASGAEGVILGCTEISMLVPPESATVRLFDTTAIHARAAASAALQE